MLSHLIGIDLCGNVAQFQPKLLHGERIVGLPYGVGDGGHHASVLCADLGGEIKRRQFDAGCRQIMARLDRLLQHRQWRRLGEGTYEAVTDMALPIPATRLLRRCREQHWQRGEQFAATFMVTSIAPFAGLRSLCRRTGGRSVTAVHRLKGGASFDFLTQIEGVLHPPCKLTSP